jgi:predicted RNA-binding Zn ribbon-like protein
MADGGRSGARAQQEEGGERPDARDRGVRDCPVVHQLSDRPGDLRARLVSDVNPVDELLARASDSAIELAGAVLDAGLFCDAPSCGQFFTRSRPNQRWCGPACGTRARVARHAAHRTASPGGPPPGTR